MAEEMQKQDVPPQQVSAPQRPPPVKKEHIKGLEDIVDTLTEDVVKALNIKEQRKQLSEKIRKLKQQELHLRDVVGDLKITRDKLQSELQKKAEDISTLQSKIENLKDDRAHLASEKVTLQAQIKSLESEKHLMSVSLEKTNDMLTTLRRQIETFDEEIKK
jgi:chromosome segregation ATPase